MRKFIAAIILIIFSLKSFGQDESDISFGIGEKVNVDRVVVDAKDGILVSGSYKKDHVNSDLIIASKAFSVPKEGASFIVKFDTRQSVQWFHFIRSFNSSPITLLTDDSCNVYLVGVFERFLDFDNKDFFIGGIDKEIFVAKYTAGGQLAWVKKYGGFGDEKIGKPFIDKQANIFIPGRFFGNFAVNGNVLLLDTDGVDKSFMLKIDKNGAVTWVRKFDDANVSLTAVGVNQKNEIFITGTFNESATFQPDMTIHSTGGKDIFYAKYREDGAIEWIQQKGGPADDDCNDLEVDNQGHLYMAGTLSADTASKNLFSIKANETDGSVIWSRSIIASKDQLPTELLINDILVNKTGDLCVLGFAEGTELTFSEKIKLNQPDERFIFLTKYTATGDLIYAHKESVLSQFGYATSMAEDSQRNIYTTNFYNFRGFTYSILRRKTEIDRNDCNTASLIVASIESCAGQDMRLSDNTILLEDDFTYQWYKNGELIRGATFSTYLATEEGFYGLRLRRKSDKNCEVEASNHIRVTSKEFYAYKTTDLAFHYDAEKALLQSNAENDEWYRDEQLISHHGSELLNPSDGTYKIKRLVAECGVRIESNEIVVRDKMAIEIERESIDGLGNHCEPFPYFKIKTDIKGEDLRYQWFINNRPIQDSVKNHLMAISSGDYHVSVVIPHTGKTYISGKYKLSRRDYLQALPLSKTENGCGSAAIIKIDDAFANKYLVEDIKWSLNGKELIGEKELFIRAVESGEYTSSIRYTIFYSDRASCEYNSFTRFEKKPDFNVNIGYSYAGSGCMVDSFKAFVEANTAYKYDWTRNDTTLADQHSNELFIRDKAVYRAYVNRGDGCIKESDEISMNGCTPETSSAFLLMNPPVISAERTTVFGNEPSFIKAEGCSGVNFQWMKDNVPIEGANGPNLELKQTGAYSLKIEKAGCVSVSDKINIVVESILSEETSEEIEINVFPNPAEETLQITMPAFLNAKTELVLMNTKGEKLREVSFTGTTTINLKSLPDGVYILRLESDNHRFLKKIYKKR